MIALVCHGAIVMTKRDEETNLPPIPDGGLTESMPEWLRRPPAWRTLRDSEVVQTPPVEPANLPEPDTSPIDPRTFLADDDLPAWLRRLGRARGIEPSTVEHVDVVTGDEREPVERPQAPPGDPELRARERFVPLQPAPPAPARRSAIRPAPSAQRGGPPSPLPWWQGSGMVLLLGTLLIVAIVMIVILAVA